MNTQVTEMTWEEFMEYMKNADPGTIVSVTVETEVSHGRE